MSALACRAAIERNFWLVGVDHYRSWQVRRQVMDAFAARKAAVLATLADPAGPVRRAFLDGDRAAFDAALPTWQREWHIEADWVPVVVLHTLDAWHDLETPPLAWDFPWIVLDPNRDLAPGALRPLRVEHADIGPAAPFETPADVERRVLAAVKAQLTAQLAPDDAPSASGGLLDVPPELIPAYAAAAARVLGPVISENPFAPLDPQRLERFVRVYLLDEPVRTVAREEIGLPVARTPRDAARNKARAKAIDQARKAIERDVNDVRAVVGLQPRRLPRGRR